MKDLACILMGIADLIAGILIIVSFGEHIFGIIFGGIMIIKGGISFL